MLFAKKKNSISKCPKYLSKYIRMATSVPMIINKLPIQIRKKSVFFIVQPNYGQDHDFYFRCFFYQIQTKNRNRF